MSWQTIKKVLLGFGMALLIQVLLLPGLMNTTLLASEKQITAAATLWPP